MLARTRAMSGVDVMEGDTATIELDRYERGAVLLALTDERNKLLSEKRPTDTVDDVLIKLSKIKPKKRDGRDAER